MKAVVAAFNQEKALVVAFSVITNLRMELFEALVKAAPLESLDLSSNQLAWLGAELVPWQLVTQLQLDHNPLHCHCRLDWLLQLPPSARVSAMVSCYSLK